MTFRKKLIEVALPLEAINVASAREKSIRHGHPSTLHLWWARRPLAAARAVIFSSLVDDPDSPDALPAFVEACKALPVGPNVHANGDTPRMRLFDFIERLVQWESTTNEEILNTARELIMIATEGNPPPLLDPFAGGGTIPLEAQRLGLEAHASDLNPVAVMINKAQIEIPPRFANQPPVNPRDRAQMFGGSTGPAPKKSKGKASAPAQDATWKGAAGLAADVRYYGEWMHEKAWERIGHLYPTHNGETVIAWLWARTVKSPNPAVNIDVPLVRSFELSKKKGRRAWVEPQIDSLTKKVSFIVCREQDGEDPESIQEGTINRRGGRDIATEAPIPLDYIRAEAQAGRMGAMLLAIVTEGKSGRNYYAPDQEHEITANKLQPDWKPDQLVPTSSHDVDRLPMYGMFTWGDAFTKRQLVTLNVFLDLISQSSKEVFQHAINSGMTETQASEYTKAVVLYLAFALSRSTNMWSSLSRWSALAVHELPLPVFARQALAMVWDYAEANPFSNSGGNWLDNFIFIPKTLMKMPENPKFAQVFQHDAINEHRVSDVLISTDPPYYDNISYADLSDYFYVWLRRSLQNFYPEIFGTVLVPKEGELVASAYKFSGNKQAANQHFENGLHQAFSRIFQASNKKYPISIYYAFKQIESDDEEDENGKYGTTQASTGWETMLSSLISAGFTINGTWPVRTERPTGLKAVINALASSIILICRPRANDASAISRRQFIDALRRELPAALKDLQSGNIAPVDLAQTTIGPGMAIYTRYSAVLEADGTPMRVRTALGLINQELDAYLAEQDGEIDPDTRFAVAWFEQFDFREGEFGHADVLARAKNTSVAGVESARLVASGRGKVRLIHWKEYDPGAWNPQSDKRPTVWEATHHLIERLTTHGETGSAQLMLSMPPEMAAEARNLAYRLYSICERKGWAEHARDYNALVVSWAGIGEETARLRENEARGSATKQMGLFD